MRIVIYDLDRTLTRRPTFTPFLHYAAWRIAPWRLAFSPAWIVLMALYRLGLFSRTTLKRLGMRMMLGSADLDALAEAGAAFARWRIAGGGLARGTLRLVEEDRQRGARVLLATAAFEFYAQAFAGALGIEDVIGTRWDGRRIPGGNCYGETKKARVLAWMAERGFEADCLTLRFVSDSFADAPLLELADEPIFVTSSPAAARRARARGLQVIDPAT